MSEVKVKEAIDINHLARKSCSKDHGHAKTNSPTKESLSEDQNRRVHSGIKFHVKKSKLTVPKPFSFDVGPSPKKVTRTSPEKSTLKHTHVEEKNKGTVKHVKITTEHIKVSKETSKCSSTRSKERLPKSPVNDVASPKKPSIRCSKAKKSEDQPFEIVKSPAVTRKSEVKVSNVTKSVEKPCTKTKAQLLYEKDIKVKSSTTAKADGKDSNAKQCSKAVKHKSESSTEIKSETVSSNADVKDKPLPNGIGPRSEDTIHEENESDSVKTTKFWPDPELSNGGTSIKEINLEYEISKAFEHTTIESVVTKSVSKNNVEIANMVNN